MDVSPQLKNQIAQFQQLQQQLQAIGNQHYQMELQLKEIEHTLEELGKLGESSGVYKSIGSVMVKVDDIAAIKKDLDDKKETTGIRIKALQKQEDSLKERYQTLHESLSKALQGGQPDGAA